MAAQRRSRPWVAAGVGALVLSGGCDSESQDSALSPTQATHSTQPTYSGVFGRAALAQCKADVATVSTAEEAFYGLQSSYPAYSTADSIQEDLVPRFLHAWPTDTTITYAVTSDGFTVTGSNHGQVC